jgi:drug/metabolite transporter (DMT)-like permease
VAIVSLLLTVTIWGSTFVVTKVAIAEVSPLLLALIRFIIASAIFLALVQPLGGLSLLSRPVPWLSLSLMGLSGVTIFYLAFNLALAETSATASALIQGAVPAFTAIFAMPFLGERLGPRRGLGIGASIIGVVIVVLVGGAGGDAPNPLLGDLLMLVAVLAWCAYTILGKGIQAASPLAVTAYSSVIGTVALVPIGLFDLIEHPPTHLSLGGLAAVLYLSVAASAVTLLLWNRALRTLDASQAANFINVVPIVGVGFAAIFLGEPLLPLQLAGGVLVLAGVWLSSRS